MKLTKNYINITSQKNSSDNGNYGIINNVYTWKESIYECKHYWSEYTNSKIL